MSINQPTSISGEEMQGKTARGAWITITPNTPYVHYRDQVVYFCGQDCMELYDDDPLNSCMAAHLLSGK
jgi:YHS domain-containing protein